jgi:hypothetical protein
MIENYTLSSLAEYFQSTVAERIWQMSGDGDAAALRALLVGVSASDIDYKNTSHVRT